MKTPEETTQVDEDLFVLGAMVELPIYSFYLGAPAVRGKAYVPNFAPRLGPRIIYKKVGLKVGIALPMPDSEIERRGSSRQTNLILSFYWKKQAFDFYYQYFRGFYVSSPLTELDPEKPDRYPQLPNATSMHWGLNWYYNLNPSQYSLDSAFDQAHYVMEEGNSWVLIPFFRHWKIDLGGTLIPGSNPNDVNSLPDLNTGRFDTLGASLAYAKTWLFGELYLSALTGLGPGLQVQHYHEGGGQKDNLSLAGKLNFNLSLGMKPKTYAIGTTFLLDTIYSRIDGKEVYSTFASVEGFINRSF